MNAAFEIDGVCLDENDKKVLLSVSPALLGQLSNQLVTCAPLTVVDLQQELDDLDAKIAGWHIHRAALKERIRLAWGSAQNGDKRWKAIRACGHQLRNAIAVLFAENVKEAEDAAERNGWEIYNSDNPDVEGA